MNFVGSPLWIKNVTCNVQTLLYTGQCSSNASKPYEEAEQEFETRQTFINNPTTTVIKLSGHFNKLFSTLKKQDGSYLWLCYLSLFRSCRRAADFVHFVIIHVVSFTCLCLAVLTGTHYLSGLPSTKGLGMMFELLNVAPFTCRQFSSTWLPIPHWPSTLTGLWELVRDTIYFHGNNYNYLSAEYYACACDTQPRR